MAILRIGTAGWAIPRAVADSFPTEGTGLQRYTARLNAVEINATFYRPPRAGTMARWADATPPDFRFAMKAPKAVTHEARLADCPEPMVRFLTQAAELGPKLGPILLQLPPSLAFDAEVARRFFGTLREMFDGQAVCEPRHPTWFDSDSDALLTAHHIGRVAADPARVPVAAIPGGWPGVAYWRLHGSPRMYFSAYDDAALGHLAKAIAGSESAERWCVFDNTASGAAAEDALRLGDQFLLALSSG